MLFRKFPRRDEKHFHANSTDSNVSDTSNPSSQGSSHHGTASTATSYTSNPSSQGLRHRGTASTVTSYTSNPSSQGLTHRGTASTATSYTPNPSSQGSSHHGTASTATSYDSDNPDVLAMMVGADEKALNKERWTRLTSILQITIIPSNMPTFEARRCAQGIARSRLSVERQYADPVVALLSSLAKTFYPLKIAMNTLFNTDAIPHELPNPTGKKPTKINLPAPQPLVTIGYTQAVFDPHRWELQQGIISDRSGEPRDLGRISQSAPGTYWPFLVVDVRSDNMFQARNVCTSSTATCNNSLVLLAAAIHYPLPTECNGSFFATLSKAVNSFSLAVSGESACLFVHKSVGPLATAIETIGEYKLSKEQDVEELASRITCIYAWACHIRLPAITSILDKFAVRVQFLRNN